MCSEKLPARYTRIPSKPKNLVPREDFIKRPPIKIDIFIISQNIQKHKLCKPKKKG